MIQIIDASVAIKWFVDNEPKRDAAIAILHQIRDFPGEFAVPELFFNEMLSVLCRILADPKEISEYLDALQDLGLTRLGNGRETMSEAVRFAKKFRLSGYDAIYLANAKLVRGIWITADEAAHRKIHRLKLSRAL